MSEHRDLTGDSLHEPKGVDVAVLGSAYIADGLGSGSWMPPVVELSNLIEVTSLEDFPNPVSGVIHLSEGVGYIISGGVDITPNVVDASSEGSILTSFNRITDKLTTNNVGALVVATDNHVVISGVTLENTNPVGTLLALSNLGSHICLLDKVGFGSCDSIGAIGDYGNVIFDNCGISSPTPIGGVTFTGVNTSEILVRDSFFSGWAGTLLDLGTATTTTFGVTGCRFVGGSSNIVVDGLASSGNIKVSGLGYLDSNIMSGMDNPTGLNISHFDDRWYFKSLGAPPSSTTGFTAMTGNAVATAVAVMGTWYKVAGVTVPAASNERFTQTLDNELTSSVLIETSVNIQVNVSAIKIGGGNDEVEFTIFKDGGSGFSQLNLNVVSTIQAETKLRSVSLIVNDTCADGDKYSLYVRNTTSTDDVEVKDLQFSIEE